MMERAVTGTDANFARRRGQQWELFGMRRVHRQIDNMQIAVSFVMISLTKRVRFILWYITASAKFVFNARSVISATSSPSILTSAKFMLARTRR